MSPKKNLQSIAPNKFGVSFSLKQCRNFGLEAEDTLRWLLKQGFRRFRFMSYWDEHESTEGKFDFTPLDQQVELVQGVGGDITFCLGARQPRWPENHWPQWAWEASKDHRDRALLHYLEIVVDRYKDNSAIKSWQLENEALLKQFGERPEVDQSRLRAEYALVKNLDPFRPVVMTTSTSWGIPFRKPIPDIVGFSFYQIVYNKGSYSTSLHKPWLDRFRAKSIQLLHGKQSFIHELQLEPWGPKNIWEMSKREQDKSMSIEQINKNVALAKATRLYPIDLWGGEWWYWRYLQGDTDVWEAVKASLL